MNRLRSHCRVDFVDDERSYGNGVIVTLKKGWTFDELQDNRVAGEDTIGQALVLVNSATKFSGPYED